MENSSPLQVPIKQYRSGLLLNFIPPLIQNPPPTLNVFYSKGKSDANAFLTVEAPYRTYPPPRHKNMKTYDELKKVLNKDFSEARKLAGTSSITMPIEQALKMQQIGRDCYDAEESLPPDDLLFLKQSLGIDEREWQACKARFILRARLFLS